MRPRALVVGTVLLLALLPAAQALAHVAAAGTVEGVFKPIDCDLRAQATFEVDLEGDDGRLDLVPLPQTGCSAIGTQVTLWQNFCDGSIDGRIVCGDDDLSTTGIATAILETDATLTYVDDDWNVTGQVTRQGAGT